MNTIIVTFGKKIPNHESHQIIHIKFNELKKNNNDYLREIKRKINDNIYFDSIRLNVSKKNVYFINEPKINEFIKEFCFEFSYKVINNIEEAKYEFDHVPVKSKLSWTLNIKNVEDFKDVIISRLFNTNIIEVDVSKIPLNTNKQDWNIIPYAKKYDEIREAFMTLYNNGFILVGHKNRKSTFVRLSDKSTLSKYLDKYNFMNHKSCYYTINEKSPSVKKVIFIFNPTIIGPYRYNASIYNRNMTEKYTPKKVADDTIIVTFADFHAVSGGYGLNGVLSDKIEEDTSELITNIIEKYNIDVKNVIFLGVGKGAGQAIINSIQKNAFFIAVDPEIQKEIKSSKSKDDIELLYFGMHTNEISDKVKETIKSANSNTNQGTIFTSLNSPYYRELKEERYSYLQKNIKFIEVKRYKYKNQEDFYDKIRRKIVKEIRLHNKKENKITKYFGFLRRP